jgi:hypothetical protein
MTSLPASNPVSNIPAHAAPTVSLTAIIQRIEDAIDRETNAIRTDIRFDIRESNSRKSRYLYELTKAMKGLGRQDLRPEHRDGILRLRQKLELNEKAILAQLNAVSEVASMIQSAIQNAEADGTYSAGAFGQAAAR